MTDSSKISKMKLLTEPIVGELLELVRSFKSQLKTMRDMNGFEECREILSVVVNLRNLLETQRNYKTILLFFYLILFDFFLLLLLFSFGCGI